MCQYRRFIPLLCLTTAIACLLSVTASTHSLADKEDVKDMTGMWGKLFNIKGKLEVSNAERDARIAAADGPIYYKIDAKLIEVGWYNFTFVAIDEDNQAFQVHTVRVEVKKGYTNSKKMIVSPGVISNQATLSIQPNEIVGVHWSYYPGGEGVIGGWILKSVTYAKSKSGLTGYEENLSPL